MAEDSRNDLMARVRKLNAVTEALKNHPLPPQVAEMAAKLEEKVRYLSWGDIQEQRAELQAKAAKRQAAAQNPTASPAPAVTAPCKPATEPAHVVHSTKERRDSLKPVIELAQQQCRNPGDAAEVWSALQVLAENKRAPLIGATEDGLQYLKGGTAAILNRGALKKRLNRAAGKRR